MLNPTSTFLTIQAQFKILHWQTQSYAKHKAYGEIYEALDGLIDTFMEVYMGKYGRPQLTECDEIKISNLGEIKVDDFLNTIIEFLCSFNEFFQEPKDSDLLNIRDEMMAEVNKLKYLITLR
jgi:hypothetical protein